MEAKTKRYLPVLKGEKNYIVPDDELKTPYNRYEAATCGVDTGSITVVMFCKNLTELMERQEAHQFL